MRYLKPFIINDLEDRKMELRFIRDTDRREVDFVVIKNKKPLFAVECKTGDKSPSPHTFYFRERTSIPRFYQVHLGNKHFGDANHGTEVIPFKRFCMAILNLR